MKKIIIIATAVILVVALLVLALSLSFCGSKTGKPLIKYENKSVSVNLYKLYLSRIKATLASYGYDVSSDTFWNTVIDKSGKTWHDYYLEVVLEETKQSLAILCLFDDLEKEGKVSFTKEHKQEIEDTVKELMEYDAEGSEKEFNAILMEYGANTDVLKLAYEIEIKKELITTYYYGRNGYQIADNVKQEYLEENYVAFKQILFANFYYEYEKDKNGDDIYYTESGKIAYDRTNGTPSDEEDSDGNIIYCLEDGKIAYDKNVGKRKNLVDKNGKAVMTDYTDKEMQENYKLLETVVAEIKDGDTSAFERNMYKYAEYANATEEELGGLYYLRSNETSTQEYINTIVDSVKSMNVGEIKVINSSYGYHVVMKYEVEEGAYSNEANSAFFDGFITDLTNKLLKVHTDKYLSGMKVETKLLEGISIKELGNNFYY